MNEILNTLKLENINEAYNDATQFKNDSLQLFSYGYLNLEQRAKAESLYWAIMTKICSMLRDYDDDHELLPILEQELSDTLYCNFSVFQSVPDAWAVKQIFPVMPIQRLKEEPTRRAVLVDLTCDSDGKLEKFAETGEVKPDLAVHNIDEKAPNYHMGVFLLGAYQEVLGDLHNLFGDTDAVIVGVGPSGYTVQHVEQGDSVTDVLAYMEYGRSELINFVRRTTEEGIREGRITNHEARLLLKHYEDGLSGYTYLEE
jgi:arginine decarboxylase